MKLRRSLVASASLMLAVPAFGQGALPPIPQVKLTPVGAIKLEGLGSAVAVSGDTALVAGAEQSSVGAPFVPVVYVFVRSGVIWSQQAKLMAPDGDDGFGSSVAVSGDTAIIGAPYADLPGALIAGASYVFVRTGTRWTEQAKLVAADAMAGDIFGGHVATTGDTALIGAAWADTPTAADFGAAYVFVRSGTSWSQQAKLAPREGAALAKFGDSVALSQDTAVVGAAHYSPPGKPYAGEAFVFVRSAATWSEQAMLTELNPATHSFFGWSVAALGDTALIGVPGDSTPTQTDKGSAYVFVRNGTGWSQQARLTAYDGFSNNYFGRSVGLSGDKAVVGAEGAWVGEHPCGSEYEFVRSGTSWTAQPKLEALDASDGDEFGFESAISGDALVIGAPYNDTSFSDNAGSAYVFNLSPNALGSVSGTVSNAITGAPILGAAVSDPFQSTAVTDALGHYAIDGVDSGLVAIKVTALGFNPVTQAVIVDEGANTIADIALAPTFANLGNGLQGSVGKPLLKGDGTLEGGTDVQLLLKLAKAFAPAILVVGTTEASAAFKGGVMVPDPQLLFFSATDASGVISVDGLWPSGLPAAFTTYFQWWIQDAGGPKGFAASNAVAGTTP